MITKATFKNLHETLLKKENPERAKHSLRFFKTGKGEYGEGDRFIGLNTPEVKNLVKEFTDLPYSEVQKALEGKFHEERLVGLLLLVKRFEKGNDEEKKKVFEMYVDNTKHINNWDLVDVTADKIVGPYLKDQDKSPLYKFSKSKSLWERRIAIISTYCYIKNANPKETLKIAEILLHDKEDLIHKAVGWMLREIGKQCGEEKEEEFLKKYYRTMPRTMLRYAIERFTEEKRRMYLEK